MLERFFGSRKAKWLTTEAVRDAIRAGATDLLENGCDCYCLSFDNRYAILVREHAAWTGSDSDREAWYSGNYPPKGGTKGRRFVNIFKIISPDGPGFWYDFFVPNDVVITGLSVFDGDTSKFVLETECDDYAIPFSKLDSFMWDALTGYAQTEDDIRDTFGNFLDL